MSTDSHPATSRRRRRDDHARRRFRRALAATLGVLVLVGLVGVTAGLMQGPRVTSVAIDSDAVAELAGQRVVFTTNSPIEPVDESQITITPAAAFTLEHSGRYLAVQFTGPLDPDTDYSVVVAGTRSVGGGPSADLASHFRTGSPPIYIMQRHAGEDDIVFRTDLSGEQAVAVYAGPRVESFRASRSGVAVLSTSDAGTAALDAVRDGDEMPVAFTLPGEGSIDLLDISDRFVGYVYTDLDIGTRGDALEAALFLARLDDPAAEPVRVDLGAESRIADWSFIPQTTSLLVLTFDGQLRLIDAASPAAEPVALGSAQEIIAVEPGTGRAYIQRPDGPVVLDLTTLDDASVAEVADTQIVAGRLAPMVGGGTVRVATRFTDDGQVEDQRVVRVSEEGGVESVFAVDDPDDVILTVCVSPSARYAAVMVAPDLSTDAYDGYRNPLPRVLHTHVVEIETGEEVAPLVGFGVNWCTGPA